MSIIVAGAGVSGQGIARLLRDIDKEVLLIDDSADALQAACDSLGIEGKSTAEACQLIDDGDVEQVVTSPGWRPDSPLLTHAAECGVEVIGDVELVWRLDKAETFGPARTWMVVTGTNGKTTTTAMLADIMQTNTEHTGLKAQAVGNIGVSVAEAVSAPERIDVLVAELSSFQLHWSNSLEPAVGILLNLAEDHLDWHGSMQAYSEDKAKVFNATVGVAGIDDERVAELAAGTGAIGFTLDSPEPGQVGVSEGWLVDNTGVTPRRIADAARIEPQGPAGVLDALAAAAAALSQGVDHDVIGQALADFSVAGHRGATAHQGRKAWIDNSKATNPHAADAALEGAGENVIWIAGGQLKGASVEGLVDKHKHRLAAAALIGVDAPVIARALGDDVAVLVVDDTDPHQAMDKAVAFAAEQTGDTVLLAPAAASLDMYHGMSHRGDEFAAAARRHDPSQN